MRWTVNDLPLVLHSTNPMLDDSVVWAATRFNEQVERELVVVEGVGGYVVNIRLQTTLSSTTTIGQTTWRGEGWHITEAGIDVKLGLSPDVEQHVILHELGHVFGINHDGPLECTVMRPAIEVGCDTFKPEVIEALQHLYGATTTGAIE